MTSFILSTVSGDRYTCRGSLCSRHKTGEMGQTQLNFIEQKNDTVSCAQPNRSRETPPKNVCVLLYVVVLCYQLQP